MLRYLQIRDFAIIDSVELEFSGGLTVLTGETGAGKSIIVDALELLAGGRAGAMSYAPGGARRAVGDHRCRRRRRELRHLLDEQSIAHEGELVLRRVIGSDGQPCVARGQPYRCRCSAASRAADRHSWPARVSVAGAAGDAAPRWSIATANSNLWEPGTLRARGLADAAQSQHTSGQRRR